MNIQGAYIYGLSSSIWSVVPDATSLYVRGPSQGVNIANKTTCAAFNATNTNWKSVFRAWVFY